MTRRAILQIGTEKTGTTTLQVFLKANRDRLRAQGFVYPRFCGDVNQTGLAVFAMDDARADPLKQSWNIGAATDMDSFRRRFRAEAALELGDGRTAIFCNEHCHSRLKTPAEVARLRNFLAGFFDEIRVSVYLRRQDELALSLYTTRLKSGATDSEMFPRTSSEDLFFNYDRSLRLWEDAFGRENIHVRLFGRSALTGGSIVTDFLTAWAIGTPADFAPVADQNESLQPAAQEFLRQLNFHLGPEPGGPSALPRELVAGPLSAALSRHFAGRGAQPGRAEAMAFYDLFRASNAALAARYFPGSGALFSEDFSTYPEVAESRGLDIAAAARIAARLHETAQDEIRRLEAEIAIRDAQIAWDRGDGDRAVRRLREAGDRCRSHPPLFRCLGEMQLRSGDAAGAAESAARATELNPNASEYWHFRGIALARAGVLAEAELAQRTALARDPGNEAARTALRNVVAAMTAAAPAPPVDPVCPPVTVAGI